MLEIEKADILKYLVLVGSWVLMIYKELHKISGYQFTTSDIDFSIYRPQDLKTTNLSSIHVSLTKLGYVPKHSLFNRSEKYVPAPDSEKNNLMIEFLCAFGRLHKEPFKIKGLDISTTPLTYQDILLKNTQQITYRGITVTIPEPGVWAIHKVAISQCRSGKDSHLKMMKDLENASVIVGMLGKEIILRESKQFTGKFYKLFKKGWEILIKKDMLEDY